jgi:hypothetical protein
MRKCKPQKSFRAGVRIQYGILAENLGSGGEKLLPLRKMRLKECVLLCATVWQCDNSESFEKIPKFSFRKSYHLGEKIIFRFIVLPS